MTTSETVNTNPIQGCSARAAGPPPTTAVSQNREG